MWWAKAIGVGLQLFGAGQQRSAGMKARAIGGMNARAERLETDEQIRRTRKEHEFQEGYARTTAGASGFSIKEGTGQQTYIDAMVAENTRQRKFTKESSVRKQAILKSGGEAAYSQAKAGMWSSLAGAASSAGSAYEMWKTK